MRAVSGRYLNAIAGGAQTTSRVRPVNPTVRDGAGYMAPSTVAALPIEAGEVILDGTADTRMRVEGLAVAAYWPDTGQDRPTTTAGFFPTGAIGTSPAATTRPGQPVWPVDFKANVTPYGKLLLVEIGVEYGNGDVEYARLGYVRIDTMYQENEPDGPIEIETSDLHEFLRDSEMVYDKSFRAGTTMRAIFDYLVIDDPWGGMPVGFTTGDIDLDPDFAAMTLGATATTDRDRFGFLRDRVEERGRIWYWDARGKLVVRKPPDAGGIAVDLDIGGPNVGATPLTRSGRRITREGVANVIVAEQSGVTSSPAIKALAYDGDGWQSPTYVYPFGWVVGRLASPLLATQPAADAAAATRLATRKAVPEQRAAQHAANGAIEPYDRHRVWPRGSVDPYGYTYRQVETTRIPLVPGQAQVTTYVDVRGS